MTDQHPITPPSELLQQWATEYWGNPGESIGCGEKYIAIKAAQWGADQELEATDAWIRTNLKGMLRPANRIADDLRAARRPKPPSLKEQALESLHHLEAGCEPNIDLLRRALEALPND